MASVILWEFDQSRIEDRSYEQDQADEPKPDDDDNDLWQTSVYGLITRNIRNGTGEDQTNDPADDGSQQCSRKYEPEFNSFGRNKAVQKEIGNPEKVVFIDDIQANRLAAEQTVHWQTFESIDALRAEL